jgi:hypothetical protein
MKQYLSYTIFRLPLNILLIVPICLFVLGMTVPQWDKASSFTRFLDHTQWCTTVCRTPLDEWSAHHRDLYLTTYNTHTRQTSMPPVGFEPTISTGKWAQTNSLDRVATWDWHCTYIQIRFQEEIWCQYHQHTYQHTETNFCGIYSHTAFNSATVECTEKQYQGCTSHHCSH